MNYYELFGIAEVPVVDKNTIAKKYIELQKKFHPDFFTNENEVDRDHALEQSAVINKAYNIFSNNEKTIAYFLLQKGIISDDEKYNLPQDFLMEMMELNEAVDEKNTQTEDKIKAFENDLYGEVKSLLENHHSIEMNEQALLKLKAYYYKKKYLKRILDRLDD